MDIGTIRQGVLQGLRIDVTSVTPEEMEFDMVGVTHFLANTFRRIMIAEVPTMAIEHVELIQNITEFGDEILVHRMGLIPIKADPDCFKMRPREDHSRNEFETIEFKLKAKCAWKKNVPKGSCDPDDLYDNHTVYSGDLKWKPMGNQLKRFGKNGVRPTHDDIIIAKLRPGQELEMNLLCVKGIGKDHIKFSPVATVSYRLLPDIKLTRHVEGEMADRLAACFSHGVIETYESYGKRFARVKNSRLDTCSRNVLRHEDLRDCVDLGRVRDHFIFCVESVGCLPAEKIVRKSFEILRKKCSKFLSVLDPELYAAESSSGSEDVQAGEGSRPGDEPGGSNDEEGSASQESEDMLGEKRQAVLSLPSGGEDSKKDSKISSSSESSDSDDD